jgi:hypothetical protein
MRRRDFIAGIACSAPASVWPLTARAQQALPVIGFLNSGSAAEWAHLVEHKLKPVRLHYWHIGPLLSFEDEALPNHFLMRAWSFAVFARKSSLQALRQKRRPQ